MFIIFFAGIKFSHRLNISIFALQGRLIETNHVKFGMTKGHVGLPGCENICVNWFTFTGVGTRLPKSSLQRKKTRTVADDEVDSGEQGIICQHYWTTQDGSRRYADGFY